MCILQYNMMTKFWQLIKMYEKSGDQNWGILPVTSFNIL